MFGKKKQVKEEKTLDFKSNNYMMKDSYNSDDLVIANLEYVSNKPTHFGPAIVSTEQKYIFEVISENGKVRYREIFTGFIAQACESHFNLPYVTNIVKLKSQIPTVVSSVPKYGLLLVLNEINTKKPPQKSKKKDSGFKY